MAAVAHPLVADVLYGGKPDGGLDRQALHAYRLAFVHPVTQQNLSFDSGLPLDFQRTLEKLGLVYNERP
jgi:23S rRNA pseudouridine1911/1915/1917 synthase